MPDCSIWLLCQRHLAENTGIKTDGFNSIRDTGILTCHGKTITILYPNRTAPSINTTATCIETYETFCGAMGVTLQSKQLTTQLPSVAPNHFKQNLSSHQCLKVLYNGRCNHKNMKAINHWIRNGYLPVDPIVASAPDPICVAC